MNADKVNAWHDKIETHVERQAERLQALKPEDPPHWGPNIRRATFGQSCITFNSLIASHFEGKRYRGKAYEQRKECLADEIRALPRTQRLLARLVDLGVIVQKTESQ